MVGRLAGADARVVVEGGVAQSWRLVVVGRQAAYDGNAKGRNMRPLPKPRAKHDVPRDHSRDTIPRGAGRVARRGRDF